MAKIYLTYYEEYPIYEPAEGGYYYTGRNAIESHDYNSIEEALKDALEFIEDDGEMEFCGESAEVVRDMLEQHNGCAVGWYSGYYIGEGRQLYIENEAGHLDMVAGYHPYE